MPGDPMPEPIEVTQRPAPAKSVARKHWVFGLAGSSVWHCGVLAVLAAGLPTLRIAGCNWQPPSVEVQQGRASVALMASVASQAQRQKSEPLEVAELPEVEIEVQPPELEPVEVEVPKPDESLLEADPWERPSETPPPPAADPPAAREAAVEPVARREPQQADSQRVALPADTIERRQQDLEVAAMERPPGTRQAAQPQASTSAAATARPTIRKEAAQPNLDELAADEINAAAQAASAASKAREGAVDELPRIVSNPSPVYPPQALLAGITGRVVLRVMVDESGAARRVNLLTSSGHEPLDAAALTAVRRWKFRPAQLDGKSVRYEVAVPVRFTLR